MTRKLTTIEKPEIPQFVGEFIEKNRRKGSDPVFEMCAFYEMAGLNGYEAYETGYSRELAEWYQKNSSKYYFACLIGYAVKEEKRFAVELNDGYLFSIDYEPHYLAPAIETIGLKEKAIRFDSEKKAAGVVYMLGKGRVVELERTKP